MEFEFLVDEQVLAGWLTLKFVLTMKDRERLCTVSHLMNDHAGMLAGVLCRKPEYTYDGAGSVRKTRVGQSPELHWESMVLGNRYGRVAPEDPAVCERCAQEICERLQRLFALRAS